MLVEVDTESGAAYVALSDHRVTRTEHIDDLVMVDFDDASAVVGVEFAAPPTEDELNGLAKRYPDLADAVRSLMYKLPPT